jgi:predicted CxxxxCH...CXXCH cytochrome family protein
MESCREAGDNERRKLWMLVLLLGIVLATGRAAEAAPQYDVTCDSCHHMPPLDSALGKRVPQTGAFKGNHQQHANSTAQSCIKCHGDAVLTYPTGHLTKQIHVQGNINSSPAVATYSRAPFFNQTSIPPNPLGTCANVNCHFERISPQWGSAPLGAADTTTCATCHDALPATYAHGRHLAKYGNNLASCGKCHPDHTTFMHATSAGQAGRAIDLTVGTYTGSNFNYLPSQAGTRTVGACSTSYCHSSGQGATANASAPVYAATPPNWGGTISCGSCHATSGLATGSHAKHLAADTNCGSCHAGASLAAYDSATHVDGQIDVGLGAYTAGGAPGNGYGSCSTAACHANVYGTGTVATPTWGVTAGCAACHKDGGAFTADGSPATGSHALHMALAGSACNQCHAGAVKGTSGGSSHANGTVEVSDGYTASPVAKHAASTFSGTCSTAACHGYKSPVWGANTANATCTKCHGKGTSLANYSTANAWQAAPGYGATGTDVAGQTGTFTNGVSNDQQVGAHDAHLRSVNGYTDRRILCTDCHAIPASTLHADGVTGFSWSSLAKNIGTTGSVSTRGALAPAYAAGTCSTNYCHGGVLNGGAGTTPGWNDTAYLTPYAKNAANCGKCHGAPPTSGATLGYSHGGLTIDSSCTQCHGHEGSGPTHMDGILQAAGGACNSCHSYDTVGGVWGSGSHMDGAIAEGWGAHARHIDHLKAAFGVTLDAGTDTFGSAAFNSVCGVCHTQDPANHTMDNSSGRMINFNGDLLTYKFGGAAPVYNGVSGTSSAVNPKTCSNISCHFGVSPRWQ